MDKQANEPDGGGAGRPQRTVLLARFLLVLALGVGLLTYPVGTKYANEAKLVQLVKPSAESALFGEVGELIGSPQLIVTKIPSEAVIKSGDEYAGSASVVDINYLEKHGIYPVQLQTVQFIIGNVRLASWIVAGTIFLYLLVVQFRKRRRQGVNPAMT